MSSFGSFKLVPSEGKKANKRPRIHSGETSSQYRGNSARKLFIGGIGTQLTSSDLIKSFRKMGIDIVNKPIRILRGKTFNFAPGVEVKTNEQWQRMISAKRMKVSGCVLEFRPLRVASRRSRNDNRGSTASPKSTTLQSPPEVVKSPEKKLEDSEERQNKLKMKLYELKLMHAENLLMKAKLEQEIHATQVALEKERKKFKRYSRSYGSSPDYRNSRRSPRNLSSPATSPRPLLQGLSHQECVDYEQQAREDQKAYLDRLRHFGASQREQKQQRNVTRESQGMHGYVQNRRSSRDCDRMAQLDKQLRGLQNTFYPTPTTDIARKGPNDLPIHDSGVERSSHPWNAMSPPLSPQNESDPVLIENMGSLEKVSTSPLNNALSKIDCIKTFKQVDLNCEFGDKPHLKSACTFINKSITKERVSDESNIASSILLLVKDNVEKKEADEINVNKIMSIDNEMQSVFQVGVH